MHVWSCAVFEARFSFAFVPVRRRNHFCLGFSEPARLLSAGYEAEIRRTSSLGRGALSDFFSCVFAQRSEASERRDAGDGVQQAALEPNAGAMRLNGRGEAEFAGCKDEGDFR